MAVYTCTECKKIVYHVCFDSFREDGETLCLKHFMEINPECNKCWVEQRSRECNCEEN